MINWKTTLGGIFVLLATTGQTVAALMSAGTHINWAQIAIQIGIGISLILAKDFNVTGIGKDATTKVATLLLVGFVSLGTTGCGGSLHGKIQQVIVAENLVKGEEQILEAAIEAQIPLLPLDKQQAVRSELAAIETKIGQAIVVKDTALQTALDASSSTVDFNKLMSDILVLIPELIALAQNVSVQEDKIQPVRARLQVQKARFVK